MQRRTFNGWAAMAAAGCFAPAAKAQADKAISLVVGFAPGGSADFIARLVGAEMAKRLGRTVVVENAAGASGTLAVQRVLSGPADGNLLYMAGTDTVVVPLINQKVRHEWSRDFVTLGRISTVPMVFAVPAASPHGTLADLIAHLRKTGSDSFTYGTPGIGTLHHFYGALINKRAGVSMLHVPYRGGAQVANDLVGSQLNSAMLVLSTGLPFLKDGKIRALSVSDTARVPQLPTVRALGEEEGFGGVSLPLWQGLFVKAGTAPATVAALEAALLSAMTQAEVKSRLLDSGVTPAPMDGQEFRAFIQPQAALYRDIATSAKITMTD